MAPNIEIEIWKYVYIKNNRIYVIYNVYKFYIIYITCNM